MSNFWESYRYLTTKMTAVCPQLPISMRTYDHFTATKIAVSSRIITIATISASLLLPLFWDNGHFGQPTYWSTVILVSGQFGLSYQM